MMKRFYVKRVSDFVTIMHRPTHQMIMMGNMDTEMEKQIKKFIKMSTEEFYRELHSLGFKFKTTRVFNEEINKEKEGWYTGAWLYTTNEVLKHFNIELDSIPEEKVPLELLEEFQREERTGWSVGVREETKEALEKQEEAPEEKQEQEKEEKPKKVLKKKTKKIPKKVSNEKVVSLVTYKTEQELREALDGGNITMREFIKLKRTL